VLQSEARLLELHRALSKLHLMTALMTLLLLGTSCVQIPRLILYARGETLTEIVDSPTRPDDPFPWLSGASTFMDVGAIFTVLYENHSRTRTACKQRDGRVKWGWRRVLSFPSLIYLFSLFFLSSSPCVSVSSWYAWTSPRVWMGEARRARGLAFWPTLLHGVDEAAWERYAPGGIVTEHKKKTESLTGSSLHANHTTAGQGTGRAITLTVATVPTTAIGPPPATANSSRNAW